MTKPKVENYTLAREAFVATGIWTVEPTRGLVHGVRGVPFRRKNSYGYVQIKFRHPDAWQREVAVLAHRIVWESVHGPIPVGLEINHRNGVKDDNRLVNLELVTGRENAHHAWATGLHRSQQGAAHGRARLTDRDALTIYQRAWAGELHERIAADYPIGRTMVGNIKAGLRWAHVTGHVQPTP